MRGQGGEEQGEGVGVVLGDPDGAVSVGVDSGRVSAEGWHAIGADDVGVRVEASNTVGSGCACAVEVTLDEPDVAERVDAELFDVVVGVLEGDIPLGDGAVGGEAAYAGGLREPLAAVVGELEKEGRRSGGDGVLCNAAGGGIQEADGVVGAVGEPDAVCAYLDGDGLSSGRDRILGGGVVGVEDGDLSGRGFGVPDAAVGGDVRALGQA